MSHIEWSDIIIKTNHNLGDPVTNYTVRIKPHDNVRRPVLLSNILRRKGDDILARLCCSVNRVAGEGAPLTHIGAGAHGHLLPL